MRPRELGNSAGRSGTSLAGDMNEPPDQAYEWTTRRIAVATGAIAALALLATTLSYHYFASQPYAHADTQPSEPKRKLIDLYNTANLQVERDTLLRGGPWKDGIPSLTTKAARRKDAKYPVKPPSLVAPDKIDWLADDDRVLVVTINQQTRAYPLNVLNWHEIVNDQLGGEPIAAIYCPLCDSASVLSRKLGDNVYEFGVSGLLHKSNVVFYDRTDQALWSQMGLMALSGPNAGKSPKHINTIELLTFAQLKAEYPKATVLDRDTGYERRYDGDPYANYFASDRLMFEIEGLDKKLAHKTPVIGVKVGDTTKAYLIGAIADAPGGRVVDELGGGQVEVVADENGVRVIRAPEGAAVSHTFWFAWQAFYPQSELWGKPKGQNANDKTAP